MKITLFVSCLVLAFALAQGAIGGYDYCGKPCTDGNKITCAYNNICYNVYANPCEMKKRNCDFDDRFREVQLASCLLASNKCRF